MDGDDRDMEIRLAALRTQTGSDYSAAARYDESSRDIRWQAASGNRSGRYRYMTKRPGEGLAGEAVRFGTLVRRAYRPNERKRSDDYTMMAEELLHAMAAPIPGKRGIGGVLLIGRRTEHPYGEREAGLLLEAADAIKWPDEARS